MCSVDIMRGKLDSEELGIITRTSFMDEFFPEDDNPSPTQFALYHYNGLSRSCPQGKVSCSCVCVACYVSSVYYHYFYVTTYLHYYISVSSY